MSAECPICQKVAHFYSNVSNVPGMKLETRAKARDYIEEPFCGSRPRCSRGLKPAFIPKILLANPHVLHVSKYLLHL